MLVFQGLVSAEHEWLWIHLGNKDLRSTILILLYEGWFNFFWNSQLTIFTTKYGGDPFNDVPLLCNSLCSLYVIQDFLLVSGKAQDIWSISTALVSDQELLLASWYLAFLNIKVFLRHLFFSSSIWLSNLYTITNCFKLFTYFIGLFFHFKL